MPTTTQDAVPTHGHERLQRMKNKLFTSDLTVNEFLLIEEMGFKPAGMVVGSSMYHIGFQRGRWSKNEEMQVLTQAMYHARELAMERMQKEAIELDADGIVGVRLTVKHMPWNTDMAEFVAIGTAVYHKEEAGAYRTHDGKPFTSDLSGQDFYTLLKAGYRPVGLVMGTCVYHVAHRGFWQAMSQAGQNVEMVNFTQALYDARELSMERMQDEAEKLQAEGIVGVNLHEGTYGWSPNVIEFFAVGTAIVAMSKDHHIPAPQLVLSVND